MALIPCKSCGKQISDRAANCPHCGALQVHSAAQILCEDCGKPLPESADVCPHCGCPVAKKQPELSQDAAVKSEPAKESIPVDEQPAAQSNAPRLDLMPPTSGVNNGAAGNISRGEGMSPVNSADRYAPGGSPAAVGRPAAANAQWGALPAMPPKKKKVLPVIIILIAVVLVAGGGAVWFFLLNGSPFEKIADQIAVDYPSAAVVSAADGSYLKIDTNPSDDDTDVEDMIYSQYQEYMAVLKDSNDAIKYVNRELGFSEALYEKMSNTNSLMGQQTEESKQYRVSWSYHPDNGLEVIYEKK